MVDSNDLPSDLTDSLDRIVELPHLFELDLKHMAMMNLDFTLGGIVSMEKEYENYVYECKEDEDTTRSLIRENEIFCDGLRLAAYRMATVTLVTRFQHWIAKLAAEANRTVVKNRNASMLVLQLQALNDALGDGPTPVQFFDELEEVRNSVIHADSAAEWESQPGKHRRVADQYRNSYNEVEISEDQLKNAVTQMIEQVKWYESKLP